MKVVFDTNILISAVVIPTSIFWLMNLIIVSSNVP